MLQQTTFIATVKAGGTFVNANGVKWDLFNVYTEGTKKTNGQTIFLGSFFCACLFTCFNTKLLSRLTTDSKGNGVKKPIDSEEVKLDVDGTFFFC